MNDANNGTNIASKRMVETLGEIRDILGSPNTDISLDQSLANVTDQLEQIVAALGRIGDMLENIWGDTP